MSEPIYRYFTVRESDIPQIISAYEESFGEYERRSRQLREKHNIHKFMIYRNAIRSERARKRGIDDPMEYMDVLVLFRKTEQEKQAESLLNTANEADRKRIKQLQKDSHPGFTSVNGSVGKVDPDYILYKVDLRKREGKEIFSQFIELYSLNPDDKKLYQYIAECFGLLHTLVPNRSERGKLRYAYYDTYGERVGSGTEACWIFAAPVYSPKYAAAAGHRGDSPRGLKDDFTAPAPVAEISEEEFRIMRSRS